MEVSTCSPYSIHSRCLFTHQPPPTTAAGSPPRHLPFQSMSSVSSFFNISVSSNLHLFHPRSCNFNLLSCNNKKRRRRTTRISSVFERFTERAIKSVIFSQREARSLGKEMVFTQHLLLELIAEDRHRRGFLESGITIDEAREVVIDIWQRNPESKNEKEEEEAEKERSTSSSSGFSSSKLPFSISTKLVFETVVEFSRSKGHNFIVPEHIALGLFTVDDGSASRVLKRLGAEEDQLATVALLRLQGELAKDGREPSLASKERMKVLIF